MQVEVGLEREAIKLLFLELFPGQLAVGLGSWVMAPLELWGGGNTA